jgi:hypothetical protein
MLRDNLAGLIGPMFSSAGAPASVVAQTEKRGDAPGRPGWQSSLLEDPGAKFFCENRGQRQKKENGPGLAVITEAHGSRAVRTVQHKSHRTIDITTGVGHNLGNFA